MEEFLHQLICSSSHYLHGFLHPRISSINSKAQFFFGGGGGIGVLPLNSHDSISAEHFWRNKPRKPLETTWMSQRPIPTDSLTFVMWFCEGHLPEMAWKLGLVIY